MIRTGRSAALKRYLCPVTIGLGLLAARELENAKGELAALVDKLYCLNNYFEAWPADEKAATATDEDFFDDDE